MRFRDKVDGAEVVRYEDPSLGVYKKLTLKDGKLAGAMLVGETTESYALHGMAAQR